MEKGKTALPVSPNWKTTSLRADSEPENKSERALHLHIVSLVPSSTHPTRMSTPAPKWILNTTIVLTSLLLCNWSWRRWRSNSNGPLSLIAFTVPQHNRTHVEICPGWHASTLDVQREEARPAPVAATPGHVPKILFYDREDGGKRQENMGLTDSD